VTATVNGVAVDAGPWPSIEVAAVRELLRQRAVATGLLLEEEVDDGVVGEAIEQLLAQEVQVPTPTEEECRRHYETHQKDFRSGDLVHARHILFQITPGARVPEIRARAEETLTTLLAHPDRFAAMARELSNCPSGQQDGNLGQLGRGDTVPEFEKVLFGPGPTGIRAELLRSRHGFHILAIDRRIRGATVPFEAVQERIAERLVEGVQETALRHYVSFLASQAQLEGVDLGATPTPLVQ
jgi:peptidyl-prolyl cis-trans isomerase C